MSERLLSRQNAKLKFPVVILSIGKFSVFQITVYSVLQPDFLVLLGANLKFGQITNLEQISKSRNKLEIIISQNSSNGQDLMIEERVLAYLSVPKKFHSDNGREFVNQLLRCMFDQWGGDTVFISGRPRHSMSQGLIERGNRTIEDKLSKLKEMHRSNIQDGDSPFPWASGLCRVHIY